MRICFLVNPVAGLGGEPGLKGSDDIDVIKILSEGYRLKSYDRAIAFLESLSREFSSEIEIVVPEDPMGCSIVNRYNELFKRVLCVRLSSEYINGMSTPKHTIEFISRHSRECDLIVFVGGDGTARDIYRVLEEIGDLEKPVLGVPSGVKVYSGVFARSPETAAYVLELYARDQISVLRRPVIDADENLLRSGSLEIKSYGFLNTPYVEELIQDSKSPTGYYRDLDYEGVARYLEEIFDEYSDSLFIVGPGGSLKRILDYLSIEKTAYGVDVVYKKKILMRDLSKRELERIASEFGDVRLILTPIPGTRFLIGRGNQQISPLILRRCGRERIIIITSLSKLGGEYTLYIDSGDIETDRLLSGYTRALIGYREEIVVRLVSARDIVSTPRSRF